MAGVVIIGAGQAGVETACSLREAGYEGEVTLVGDEAGVPYQRPPLSKDLVAGRELELLPLRAPEVLAALRVRLISGASVRGIDREARTVSLAPGCGAEETLGYEHLVLATGGRARGVGPEGRILPGELAPGVHRLRTGDDARILSSALGRARSVAVVGGGVIGLEFASVAAGAGIATTVIERGPRILRRFVGADTADWLRGRHEERGVRFRTHAAVAGFDLDAAGHVRAVDVVGGPRVEADLVLIGTGVTPETGLAAAAGLPSEGGVLVDEQLRTSDPRISAIGDCALFPCAHAQGARRVESIQNATDQARYLARSLAAGLAAAARSGASATSAPYAELPWFWSVQAGVKIQVAGLAESADRNVTIGDPAAGRFSVLRFEGERLVCVESVGRPADHLAARKLLAAGAGPSFGEASAGLIDSLKSWNAVVPA